MIGILKSFCFFFRMLKSFVDTRLKIYAEKRNDPNVNALSNLSPWYNSIFLIAISRIWDNFLFYKLRIKWPLLKLLIVYWSFTLNLFQVSLWTGFNSPRRNVCKEALEGCRRGCFRRGDTRSWRVVRQFLLLQRQLRQGDNFYQLVIFWPQGVFDIQIYVFLWFLFVTLLNATQVLINVYTLVFCNLF